MTPPLTHITKPNVPAPKTTYKKRGRPVTTGSVKFPKSFSAPIETVTMLVELAEHFSLETNEAPNNSATVCIAINELHANVFGDDNEQS